MRNQRGSLIVAGFIVGVWVLWLVGVLLHGDGYNILDNVGLSSGYQDAGAFGDAFGPLTSLMTALAALGAWTALRQSKDQAFEVTFYSLLAHHNAIVSGTDILAKTRTRDAAGKAVWKTGDAYEGRDAYRRMLRILRSTIAGMKRESELERVLDGYRRFFERYEDELAHYFRTLYQIVVFIDRSAVRDKNLYMRILRAQLSNSEQILLMYNVVVGKGFWKFKELVEKYSLLHNVRLKDDAGLWEESLIKPLLNATAFRDNDAENWPSVMQVTENPASLNIGARAKRGQSAPGPQDAAKR